MKTNEIFGHERLLELCYFIAIHSISINASFGNFATCPVDSAYNAIDKILKKKVKLNEYLVQAITGGSDDFGKVHVQATYKNNSYYGFGADTDIVVASVKAYIDVLNKII